MMLWIEGAVALTITAAFVISSFFMFKPAHVEHHPLRVRIGAAIQGLVIGLLIAFVILPLRLSVMGMADHHSPSASSSLSYLPAFLLLILIRRGALLRAPVIKTYLRAYRRASLLRTLDETQKQLTRLDQIEGRSPA
ncbi:MAG: hypothetical protein JNJ73_11880 [Hyphomonadaceae bacterium]|nr:hypothetical protein [Hyphomonadaceae bacterium]